MQEENTNGITQEATVLSNEIISDEELEALIRSLDDSSDTSAASDSEQYDSPTEIEFDDIPSDTTSGFIRETNSSGLFLEPNFPATDEEEQEIRTVTKNLLGYVYDHDTAHSSSRVQYFVNHIMDATSSVEEATAQNGLLELLENEFGYDNPAAHRNYIIPDNSPTWLMDQTTSRFSGTEWYSKIQKSRIILAGIGGIGGWVALELARMHPEALYLYDDDIVELANMSGQLYSIKDVGKCKVDAIKDTIKSFTSMEGVYAISKKFTSSCEAGDIMICGFDNMNARKAFFKVWENHVFSLPEEKRKNCLYIDGRLSINTLQIFTITGDDKANKERYFKEFLFSDLDAEQTVCSMKQTTYLACMIGSFIVNLFTNFTANLLDPIIPYDLPFFVEYDAQNMLFRIER